MPNTKIQVHISSGSSETWHFRKVETDAKRAMVFEVSQETVDRWTKAESDYQQMLSEIDDLVLKH